MARVISEFGIRLLGSVFAAGDPNPTPSGALTSPAPVIDVNRVTPGNWGLLVFVGLLLVAVLLYFSLRKQLRRVNFQEEPPPADAGSKDLEQSPRIPE